MWRGWFTARLNAIGFSISVNNRLQTSLARAGMGSLLAAVVLVSTIGCTPEAYRQEADIQVERILRDRKPTALGYQPEAVADTTVAPKPAPAAYQKIPVTPIPPPIIPPMEPTRSVLGAGESVPCSANIATAPRKPKIPKIRFMFHLSIY